MRLLLIVISAFIMFGCCEKQKAASAFDPKDIESSANTASAAVHVAKSTIEDKESKASKALELAEAALPDPKSDEIAKVEAAILDRKKLDELIATTKKQLASAIETVNIEVQKRKNAEAAATALRVRLKFEQDERIREKKELSDENDASAARTRAGIVASAIFVTGLIWSYFTKTPRPAVYAGLGAGIEAAAPWLWTSLIKSQAFHVSIWVVCAVACIALIVVVVKLLRKT